MYYTLMYTLNVPYQKLKDAIPYQISVNTHSFKLLELTYAPAIGKWRITFKSVKCLSIKINK